MTAEFFLLALAAAANPSLLGVDLVLLVNQRPRAMLLCILLGGVGTAVAIGLIDVFVIRANIVKTQRGLGPGAQLAIGVLLLGAGLVLMFGHPFRRRLSKSASSQPPAARPRKDEARRRTKPSWTDRALSEPRLGLAVVVGVVLGLPGALYLAAMHHLVAGNFTTANKVLAVVLFAIIEFALVIIPVVLLAVRPHDTAARMERWHKWLLSHGRALGAWIMLGLGAYLTVSGLASLL